mmetsp:Transcript_19831/g.38872  ORF Transcript_19831/g.38872 Transcript_19831/m.38872 type:complete len:569 (+) Transcript_19831:169-1875(+)
MALWSVPMSSGAAFARFTLGRKVTRAGLAASASSAASLPISNGEAHRTGALHRISYVGQNLVHAPQGLSALRSLCTSRDTNQRNGGSRKSASTNTNGLESSSTSTKPWRQVMIAALGEDMFKALGHGYADSNSPLDLDMYKVYQLFEITGNKHTDLNHPVARAFSVEELSQLITPIIKNFTEEETAQIALELRAAMPRSRYVDCFRRHLNFDREGIDTLVQFRANLVAHLRSKRLDDDTKGALQQISNSLRTVLVPYFGRAATTMRAITPEDDQVTFEHMLQAEKVHPLNNVDELKERLNPKNRLCFGTFSPFQPLRPVIFVHVGLTKGVASSMAAVEQNQINANDADTAIFFTISSAFDGLNGVDLGHNLLYDVVQTIKRDFPQIKTFSTLSPMVGFVSPYLRDLDPTQFERVFPNEAKQVLSSERALRLLEPRVQDLLDSMSSHSIKDLVLAQLDSCNYTQDKEVMETLSEPLMKLAKVYIESKASNSDIRQMDPVANFHLRNGAEILALNWAADLNPRGLRRSASIMANYLYEPSHLWPNGLQFRVNGDVVSHLSPQRKNNRKSR